MPATLDDKQCFVSDGVYKAVFLRNPARPLPLHVIFERLWFANTLKGMSADIFYKMVYAPEHFAVGCKPILVIFPSLLRKTNPHRQPPLLLVPR